MIMNILAIAVLGGVAYAWGARGGFSSLLNCACVLLAGAIGFGLWETTAYALIGASSPRGMASVLGDIAWGAGLAIPFAIALAILRVGTDVLIRKNLKFSPAGDWIVGSVFGVISGTIISGVCVLALSGMRIGTDAFGYTALDSDGQGSVQRGSALWVPTDRITSWVYSRLSNGSFSTSEPLSDWNPDPAVFAASTRMSFGDGKGKNFLNLKDFDVLGRYVIDPAKVQAPPPPPAPAKGAAAAPAPKGDPNDLKADAIDPTSQIVKYLDGDTVGKDAKLHGVIVKFRAGAKELTSGQFIIGNGQVYLIAQNSAGEHRLFFPNATICKAEAGKIGLGRFRFDAKGTFLASLGGDSESTWAFEFLVPPDFEPTAIVVKGSRVRFADNEKLKAVELESRAKRDALVAAGQITAGKGAGAIDASKAVQVTVDAANNQQAPILYTNQIGTVLQDGTLGSSMTVSNGRIMSGTTTLSPKDASNRGVDQNLRVDRFAPPESVGLVMVDVGIGQGEAGLTGAAAREAQGDTSVPATPFVVDSNGVRYDAVGYIYQDTEKFQVRYIIGEPIASISTDVPALSRSRPDQKLRLIFAPSLNTEIVGWGVGNKLVARYVPPVEVKTPQR